MRGYAMEGEKQRDVKGGQPGGRESGMLTMRKLIQPKSARPMGTLGELFGERIRTNYELIQGRLSPADILHFLSAPPELYLAEHEMTILVNSEKNIEVKNFVTNLVNSVLNRILVSRQLALTYQDRVFVENVLRKLGVADVREWMRQVRMIKEETRNVRELLSLYESGQDAVRLILEYRREHFERQKTQEKQIETEKPEAAAYLAAAVLKRLQTEKIYREACSYATFRIGGGTTLERQELSFGEQHIAASYLTLNEYRSRFFARRQSLVYYQPQYDETWDSSHTDASYGQTVNHIMQTVLLNAVRLSFHSRYGEFTRHTGWRHEFMDALHIAVRNTCQRIARLPAEAISAVQDREAWQRTMQHFERQEIDSLRSLLTQSLQATVQKTHEEKGVLLPAQEKAASFTTRRQDTDSDVMRLEHTKQQDQPQQEAQALRLEREKEILAQLARIDRLNVERMERLAEYTRRIEASDQRQIDREKTMTETVKILGGTKQSETVSQEREMLHRIETERETEKLREILGDETVRVFETIRGYRQDPGRYPHVFTADGQAVNLLLRDIAAAEKTQNARFGKETNEVVHDGGWDAAQKGEAGALPGTVLGARSGGHRSQKAAKETERNVELFHRRTEQTISEETLQELMQTARKDKLIQRADIRETVNEAQQVTEIVQSKVNEMKDRQDEEIARMISLNVKTQLDTLSEKVYGKLERRMDAERRRRGL